MGKIVFIKLGGSLITDKTKPFHAKVDVIKNIAVQIKDAIDFYPDIQIILGNGAGSFGHFVAKKYNYSSEKGMQDLLGFAEVQDSVARLNRIVIEELIKVGIPAITIAPSAILTSSNGKPKELFLDSMEGIVSKGIVPVLYGDIVYDDTLTSYIYSTENLFEIMVEKYIQKGKAISKIIHLTVVDGVLDQNGKVIEEITMQNIEYVKEHLYQTNGYDVTGGMLHKINTSLKFAEKGIETIILNGDSNTLHLKEVLGKNPVLATVIR